MVVSGSSHRPEDDAWPSNSLAGGVCRKGGDAYRPVAVLALRIAFTRSAIPDCVVDCVEDAGHGLIGSHYVEAARSITRFLVSL